MSPKRTSGEMRQPTRQMSRLDSTASAVFALQVTNRIRSFFRRSDRRARGEPIYITGEVVAPQGIYLKEGGTSLTEAIAKVGGVSSRCENEGHKGLSLQDEH